MEPQVPRSGLGRPEPGAEALLATQQWRRSSGIYAIAGRRDHSDVAA